VVVVVAGANRSDRGGWEEEERGLAGTAVRRARRVPARDRRGAAIVAVLLRGVIV